MKNYQQNTAEPTAPEKLANLHDFASHGQPRDQPAVPRPSMPFNLSAASLLLNPLYSQMASQNATSQVNNEQKNYLGRLWVNPFEGICSELAVSFFTHF